uniref:Uncharacterized protein n=1 Tax=Panagrolaimus superbus TaxID=310955 RepID=A0A914YKN5_9BILA
MLMSLKKQFGKGAEDLKILFDGMHQIRKIGTVSGATNTPRANQDIAAVANHDAGTAEKSYLKITNTSLRKSAYIKSYKHFLDIAGIGNDYESLKSGILKKR